MKRARAAAAVITALSAITAASAHADDIVRYPIGTSFPIARAVEIPAGFKLI